MNILPLSLFCLCLCCGFSRGGQPPEGAPVRFRINMDQAAENKAPSTGPVPDQSTPLNAAKLLLRALQEKTDWKHEPYKSLPATSPLCKPTQAEKHPFPHGGGSRVCHRSGPGTSALCG